jgi:hypothetical protein
MGDRRWFRVTHWLLTIGLIGVLAFLCVWTLLAIAYQSNLLPVLFACDVILLATIAVRIKSRLG